MIISRGDLTILKAAPGLPEGTQLSRLVDALNQEEPFGVMFRQDGDKITITLPNGVSLLNWVRRYNARMEELKVNAVDLMKAAQRNVR